MTKATTQPKQYDIQKLLDFKFEQLDLSRYDDIMTQKPAKTVLTPEQERKNIEEAFPITSPVYDGEYQNDAWKIQKIKQRCALNAHKTNSRTEATLEGILACGKTAVAAISAGVATYVGLRVWNDSESVRQLIGYGIMSAPVTIGLSMYSLVKIFGTLPNMSERGNFFEYPSLSVLDHLEFRRNWKKIAKMQEEGNMLPGTKKVPNNRYDNYYQFESYCNGP